MKSSHVDGVGKMVTQKVIQIPDRENPGQQLTIKIEKNEDARYSIKYSNLLILLNEGEFVREARISEGNSSAVFLIWKYNKLGGSDHSRILAISENLNNQGESGEILTILECLQESYLFKHFGHRDSWIWSIDENIEDFPIVNLFIRRPLTELEKDKSDRGMIWEPWDLIHQRRPGK